MLKFDDTKNWRICSANVWQSTWWNCDIWVKTIEFNRCSGGIVPAMQSNTIWVLTANKSATKLGSTITKRRLVLWTIRCGSSALNFQWWVNRREAEAEIGESAKYVSVEADDGDECYGWPCNLWFPREIMTKRPIFRSTQIECHDRCVHFEAEKRGKTHLTQCSCATPFNR